jgi:uracil-DNA glycosylase
VQEVAGMPPIIATLHPSAILRAQTDEERHAQMRMLVEDLREAARVAGE